jgi:streptomycin 6-kinase
VISVPSSFRQMPRWWHDEVGRRWLDQLPALVESQSQQWGLELDGEPLHGSNALVVPVRRHGEPYALRLCPPGDDVARESRALRVWDGRGVVRLFEADESSGSMLLERLDHTHTLASEPLDIAVPIVAGLTRTLAVPVHDDVRSTAEVADEHLATFERDWTALGAPTPRGQLRYALGLAAELAAESTANLAADGDLHYEQVLASRRARWLVVDPVLLRGDPEYDLGRVLWSRLDELPGDDDVRGAFGTFVRIADVPAERARAWVVLRAMSYLLWGMQRGLTWDPPRCRRLLDLFC